MFIQKQFKVDDPERQERLAKANPLATVVTYGEDGLIANHIPCVVDTDENHNIVRLRLHYARINEQDAHFRSGKELLVIFKAEDAYITPKWYKQTKPETGKVVPTWDFSCVHVYGTPTVTDDEEYLHTQLNELTDSQENQEQEKPWKVADTPENYLKIMKKAIHGLIIDVTRVEGKWKLSQDKKGEDLQGVMDGFKNETGEKGQKLAESLEECL